MCHCCCVGVLWLIFGWVFGVEFLHGYDVVAVELSYSCALVVCLELSATVELWDCGPQAVEVHTQRFEVWSHDTRRLLFSAEDDEVQIGTEKLRVTGVEGAVFQHSVETPHIRAEPSHDLRLESPTRTLTMEAPRGVEISADAGDLRATCRKDLQLESTEGEIFLNAHVIRLGSLPIGTTAAAHGSTVPKQTVYELCACPNGRLYLSPAELESTCQATSNVCLWS
ncbi:hypothetical protein Z043_117928 [Scleropages formosus]|uniref:Zeta-sarcoglycan-like n=1 Tax=Scleropages formosus TaxID=113540 RepID=A0A0P7WQI1_SCLFO|nr:hypothetical protein Z043_117928 [Scleropages formosus]